MKPEDIKTEADLSQYAAEQLAVFDKTVIAEQGNSEFDEWFEHRRLKVMWALPHLWMQEYGLDASSNIEKQRTWVCDTYFWNGTDDEGEVSRMMLEAGLIEFIDAEPKQ